MHALIHCCWRTFYFLNISWVCSLLSIPIASTSIQLFIHLLLDYELICLHPPAWHISRSLFHAVAGRIFSELYIRLWIPLHLPVLLTTHRTKANSLVKTRHAFPSYYSCLPLCSFFTLTSSITQARQNWLLSQLGCCCASQEYLSALKAFHHLSLSPKDWVQLKANALMLPASTLERSI